MDEWVKDHINDPGPYCNRQLGKEGGLWMGRERGDYVLY